MKRKTLAWVMGLIMFLTTCISAYAEPIQLNYDGKSHVYDLPPITLYINDAVVETTVMPPIQLENRVLVPAREVFTPMGADVEWKGYEKKAYISYKDTLLIVETDNKEVWLNGETVELDVPAKIINDKIMLPIRFISESLGFEVKWVGGQNPSVHVNEHAKDNPNEYIIEEPKQEPIIEEPKQEPIIEDPGIELPSVDEPAIETPSLISKGLYIGTFNRIETSIVPIGYPATQITNTQVVQNGNLAFLTITASSEISNVNVSSANGKVILDIPSSTNKLSASITPASNTYIERIRTSQFTTTDTRIVLDLKAGAKVSTSLSVDRKQITVQLSSQSIEMITTGKDVLGDYVAIKGIHPDQFTMKDDRSLKRVTVTIPNTWLSEGFEWNNLGQEYIETFRAQNQGQATLLTVFLHQTVSYIHKVQFVEGETRIYFMKPTFKNLEYYLNGAGVIRIQKVNGLSKENITIQDQYRERQLIIDLGQQYQDHLGYGIFPIDDEKVNQIEITNQGTTKLVVKQNTIQAYNLREDDNYIYIELVKPTEKYRKIIVLDPGHGGTDPGAVAFGIRESDLNLKEALRVQQLLQQNTDIKVYMTREADTTLTLAFRTDLANEIGADAFISFHNNAAGPNISGTEVYYFGTSTIGKQMAQMVQTNILTALGSVDRKIKDGSGLYVIRTSKMPAILIEAGFVTNYEEVMKLNSDSYNEKIAKGIYDAIVKMFDTLSFR